MTASARRILFYCDGHDVGGAEVYLGSLLAVLSREWEPLVATTHPRVLAYLHSRRPDATFYALPRIRHRRDLISVARHVVLTMRLRPDILQVNLNRSWGSPWGVISGCLVSGTRVVTVEHLPTPPTARRHRLYLRLIPRLLDAMVVTSEASAKCVEATTGVSAATMTVIPPGVAERAKAPSDRDDDRPVIGTVARMEHRKGLDVLLHALERLPEARAVLVGDGAERSRLEALAESLGLTERVRFTGWLAEPWRELERFSVFVLPSRDENLPISIVEAMMVGLPVAATDVGQVSELVRPGTGILVPPDDLEALTAALTGLLADPRQRRRLGDAARAAAVDRFAMARMAERFEQLYARLTPPPEK